MESSKEAHMPDTERKADATTQRQRKIQSEQDRADAQKGKEQKPQAKGAAQAGARPEPEQLPAQHLKKPGLEAEMQLKPRFQAPDYKGSEKLLDRAAIITGGD